MDLKEPYLEELLDTINGRWGEAFYRLKSFCRQVLFAVPV